RRIRVPTDRRGHESRQTGEIRRVDLRAPIDQQLDDLFVTVCCRDDEWRVPTTVTSLERRAGDEQGVGGAGVAVVGRVEQGLWFVEGLVHFRRASLPLRWAPLVAAAPRAGVTRMRVSTAATYARTTSDRNV